MDIDVTTTHFRVSQTENAGPEITDLATGERKERLTSFELRGDQDGAYLEITGHAFPRVSKVLDAEVNVGIHRLRVVDGVCKSVLQFPAPITDPDKYNISHCTTDIGELNKISDLRVVESEMKPYQGSAGIELRHVAGFVLEVCADRSAKLTLEMIEVSSLQDFAA